RSPRFEKSDALVADFDGKVPGLLLEHTGPQSITFDWTARGDAGPDGLHFDLQVPSCAVASLELNVPADRQVAVPLEGCILSGPFPGENADRRLWRVGFAGRSQLHVLIRPGDGPGQPPPLVLATLRTRQEILPDSLEAEYQFDLHSAGSGVRELTC